MVAPLESIREPSSDCGGRCGDDCETAAVMSGHKRKLGEGKLFWLTAYLQLGNYILNTLNLSNIYKYAI